MQEADRPGTGVRIRRTREMWAERSLPAGLGLAWGSLQHPGRTDKP